MITLMIGEEGWIFSVWRVEQARSGARARSKESDEASEFSSLKRRAAEGGVLFPEAGRRKKYVQKLPKIGFTKTGGKWLLNGHHD